MKDGRRERADLCATSPAERCMTSWLYFVRVHIRCDAPAYGAGASQRQDKNSASTQLQPEIGRDHRGVGMKLRRASFQRHDAAFQDIAPRRHFERQFDVLFTRRLQSPGWLSHRRVLGLSLEGEFPEDACRVEGSSKANFFFARQ